MNFILTFIFYRDIIEKKWGGEDMRAVLGFNSIEINPYISSSFTPPRYTHSHLFFEISFWIKKENRSTIYRERINE